MDDKKTNSAKTHREYREWGECESCGQQLPLLPLTGMCGVCTFGEADEMLVEYDDIVDEEAPDAQP